LVPLSTSLSFFLGAEGNDAVVVSSSTSSNREWDQGKNNNGTAQTKKAAAGGKKGSVHSRLGKKSDNVETAPRNTASSGREWDVGKSSIVQSSAVSSSVREWDSGKGSSKGTKFNNNQGGKKRGKASASAAVVVSSGREWDAGKSGQSATAGHARVKSVPAGVELNKSIKSRLGGPVSANTVSSSSPAGKAGGKKSSVFSRLGS